MWWFHKTLSLGPCWINQYKRYCCTFTDLVETMHHSQRFGWFSILLYAEHLIFIARSHHLLHFRRPDIVCGRPFERSYYALPPLMACKHLCMTDVHVLSTDIKNLYIYIGYIRSGIVYMDICYTLIPIIRTSEVNSTVRGDSFHPTKRYSSRPVSYTHLRAHET